MSTQYNQPIGAMADAAPATSMQRFGQWVQDPMASVIVASIATMSTLGFVLSGMWFISVMLN